MVFPKFRNGYPLRDGDLLKLSNLVVYNPLMGFRQNRQYRDWSKIIVILRTIRLWDLSYASFVSIYLESRIILMNESITLVKKLSIGF